MFRFVPKFNFLCKNMKKHLNTKNHFPSSHCHLIVIISLVATLWRFCCSPLGRATYGCLFPWGNTIIIVPEKEMVFLGMLCRERSTGKINLQLLSENWAFSELMERYFLNWRTHVCEILFPRHDWKWCSKQLEHKEKGFWFLCWTSYLYFKEFCVFHSGFLVFHNFGNWVLWFSQIRI